MSFGAVVVTLWVIALFCPVPHWFALAVVFGPFLYIILTTKY